VTSTAGGLLLVLAVMLPLVGVLCCFALGSRAAPWLAAATIAAGVANAVATALAFERAPDGMVYLLGGWSPPLGIALRADGLSVVMMLAVAAVIPFIAVYARSSFTAPAGTRDARSPLVFWTLLLAIWGSLNLVMVSGDLFTLYVALELLTFAAVPLVSLDGRAETLRAALRYLLYALLGSVFYLLGAVLLYGVYGTLDIALLADRITPAPAVLAAAALMTAGLLAKTALFPLHLWLPPAHAGAPAAASAILSGLVIKGSWFLLIRLWFDVLPGIVTLSSTQLLAGLGAGAILVGNVVALRQQRLKLLVAYSTVAQIGYLFLMFPLAFDAAGALLQRGVVLNAGMLQAISHALAKSAMFMAAGVFYHALGHDRIADLAGAGRALPVSLATFALGGIALMGLPPGGAFVAKKLFLDAAADSGQWWWEIVLHAGGLLTAGYVVLVLAFSLRRADRPLILRGPVSRLAEFAALSLALGSLLLGFIAGGNGLIAGGSGLPDTLSGAFSAREAGSALTLFAGGAVLAAGLALRPPPLPAGQAVSRLARPARRIMAALGGMLGSLDWLLRHWAAAGTALVAVALAFGLAMLTGR
jgi:formate hydrogenlyase subunit 3/multisubunit Na+/H+ antiporter MnhD subunit